MTTTPCDRPGSLVTATLKLVRAAGGPLTVAQKTNVPFYWLQKFSRGEIDSPGVNRVQFLYEQLSGKKVL